MRLLFMTTFLILICLQDSFAQEVASPQPIRFAILKSDRTVRGIIGNWARQDEKKLDWKYRFSELSLLEVSLGTKRPDEYNYLLRNVRDIKEAVDALLAQHLALNVGQTVEEIYEPNTLKACVSTNVITILSSKQRCPTIEQEPNN